MQKLANILLSEKWITFFFCAEEKRQLIRVRDITGHMSKFWGLLVAPTGDLFLGNFLSTCVHGYNSQVTSVDGALALHTSNLHRWVKKPLDKRRPFGKAGTQVFRDMSWQSVDALCDKKDVTRILCVDDWRGKSVPTVDWFARKHECVTVINVKDAVLERQTLL